MKFFWFGLLIFIIGCRCDDKTECHDTKLLFMYIDSNNTPILDKSTWDSKVVLFDSKEIPTRLNYDSIFNAISIEKFMNYDTFLIGSSGITNTIDTLIISNKKFGNPECCKFTYLLDYSAYVNDELFCESCDDKVIKIYKE